MSIYYISVVVDGEDQVFELDSTTDISISERGHLSTHKLESGDRSSDNYSNSAPRIRIFGVITDLYITRTDTKKTTQEYLEGLKDVKKKKIPFTLHYSDKLDSIPNCFFIDFEYSQSSHIGHTRRAAAFSVSMEIDSARISEGATFTTGRASEFADATQDLESSIRSTKEVGGERNAFDSSFDGLNEGISSVLSGLEGKALEIRK